MAFAQCKGLCGKYYTDAYRAINPNIHVDHTRFGLHKLGFKFCDKCEMYTTKEPTNKYCRCCGNPFMIGGRLFESRQRKRQEKKGMEEDIVLTYAELRQYASDLDIHVPCKRIWS